jgi:hypothetical protein
VFFGSFRGLSASHPRRTEEHGLLRSRMPEAVHSAGLHGVHTILRSFEVAREDGQSRCLLATHLSGLELAIHSVSGLTPAVSIVFSQVTVSPAHVVEIMCSFQSHHFFL